MVCLLYSYQHCSANFYVELQQKHSNIASKYSVLIHSGSFVTTRLLEHGPYVNSYLASWKKAQEFQARKILLYWSVNCLGYIYNYIFINAHRTTYYLQPFCSFFFGGGWQFPKEGLFTIKKQGSSKGSRYIITTYWKLAWNPLLKVPGIITKPAIIPGFYPPRN